PTAGPLSLQVPQDSQLQFQLPAGDPDGDPLSFDITQAPAHGVVVVRGQIGAAGYSPNPGYCGPDAFGYLVSDSCCTSSVATVYITVLDTEAPQIANLSVDKPVLWAPDRKMKDVT